MKITLIVAVAENNVIGKNNALIWHLPKDMQYFKKITEGHHIITGRKNYISIPEKFRPLQNRTNIILTHQKDFKEDNCIILHTLEDAISFAKNNNEKELFIIGGGQIYREAIEKNVVDKMYITHVHQAFEGDIYFPEIDTTQWKIVGSEKYEKDEKHKYSFTFVEYQKIN